ncbi:MAG: hypothetical protein Q4C53_08315 [Clostridia bacterium]|nr:hypothetical protein [Clostridia bacterium]
MRFGLGALCLMSLSALAAEPAGDIEAFIAGHGSMVSSTNEAVTEEQLDAMCRAAATVTLGMGKQWQLTVIRNIDLIQELLPVYTAEGFVQEGNAAIIVSVTSDTSMEKQYEIEDHTNDIIGGMVTQQLCVAAQMQGLGFKVITDSLYETPYWIYADNIQDDEHLIQAGRDREEWLRAFAIRKEKYYIIHPDNEYSATMDGSPVPLKHGKLIYYTAEGETVNKKKLLYQDAYMTPVAIVLVGNTDEAVRPSRIKLKNVVNYWDGKGSPYETVYGGSGRTSEGGYKK